jgi:hypothetical protein
MRTPILSYVLLATTIGCGSAGQFSNDELNTLRAISGEEEFTSGDETLAPVESEAQPLFRECDAEAIRDTLADGPPEGKECDGEGKGPMGDGPPEGAEGSEGERGGPMGPPPHHFHLIAWVYDADDSLDLDDSELDTLMADFDVRCDAMHERILEEWDVDGDGVLSDEEREASREAMEERREDLPKPPQDGERPERGDAPPPVVDAYDADGDGQLSDKEAAAARSEIRDRLVAGLPPLDFPA